MPLFTTGDSTDDAVLFVTLELVVPDWFRRSLVQAIVLMTQSGNWSQLGDATVDFATDKATEMLNSIEFSEENPLPIHKLPAGLIMAYPDDTLPSGWLPCNGQSLLRATYPELFAVIGTSYGSVDGTHFNVPDLQERSITGAHHLVSGYELGDTGGEKTHVLTTTEMPAHSHTIGRGNAGTPNLSYTAAIVGTFVSTATTNNTGGGAAHENRSPYMALIQIISTGQE
jgi:microcystin-dependent protein